MDVVLGNAVVAAEMLFGLVPEVLDLVDVVAVLDLNLRVQGIKNLRGADCSVMPTLVSGNTNAPTMMIADRAVDFILQNA